MSLLESAVRLGSAVDALSEAERDMLPSLVGFASRCLDAGWSLGPNPSALEFLAYSEAGRRRRIQNAVWAGLSTDPVIASRLESELGDDTSERTILQTVAHNLATEGIHATSRR